MFHSILVLLFVYASNSVSGEEEPDSRNITFSLDTSANGPTNATLLLASYTGPDNTRNTGTVCISTPPNNTTATALCREVGFERGTIVARNTLELDPSYASEVEKRDIVLGNVSCTTQHWSQCSCSTGNFTSCNHTSDVFLNCSCSGTGRCKPGTCRPGYHSNGSHCVKCHRNSYSTGGSAKCVKCPGAKRGAGICKPCPNGKFWFNHTCALCPRAYFGDGASCHRCDEGYQSGSDGLCHSIPLTSPRWIALLLGATTAVLFCVLVATCVYFNLNGVYECCRRIPIEVQYKNLVDKEAAAVTEEPSTSMRFNISHDV